MGFKDSLRRFGGKLPMVGGAITAIAGDPDQEEKQRQMAAAIEQFKKQRVMNNQARTNAMDMGAIAFGPANQMLGEMMGQKGPAIDIARMTNSPIPQWAQDDMAKTAFGLDADGVPISRPQIYDRPQRPPLNKDLLKRGRVI